MVEYLAAVMQQTGEDWERVNVTLSTAQPMLNASPPELHTLAVAVAPRGTALAGVSVKALELGLSNNSAYSRSESKVPASITAGSPGMGGMAGGGMAPNGPPEQTLADNRFALVNPGTAAKPEEFAEAAKKLRAQSQRAANLRATKDADELANYAGVLDQVRDLVVMQQKAALGSSPKTSEGPSVIYHLASRLSVPSRTDEQVIEVTKLELDPDYYYKAVPVLSPNVYRQASLVNKSKHVLLPGEATMYHGSDFVGRMTLPLVAVGEQFTAGFGAEPQLQVSRQMMERSKTMQAGNQVLKYDYRILVSSYKTEKVKVQIWDRLPHAEKEAMGVSLIKATPEISTEAAVRPRGEAEQSASLGPRSDARDARREGEEGPVRVPTGTRPPGDVGHVRDEVKQLEDASNEARPTVGNAVGLASLTSPVGYFFAVKMYSVVWAYFSPGLRMDEGNSF